MAQIQKLIQENQKLKYQLEKFKGSNGLLSYVDDSLFKGGYRVVKTIDDRNNIDCCHSKQGMIVCVIGEDLSFKEYRLISDCKNKQWEEVQTQVTENDVILTEDYSELSEDLITQKELNLVLKQLILNLQTQIDNIELIDEKVQITENTNFAQIGDNQKDFNKSVSNYKIDSDLKNQEQDDRLSDIEGKNIAQDDLINGLQADLDNKLEKGTYTGTAQDLKNSIDSKLNKPTTTSNTTSYPYVVGEDGSGNSARLPAGDLGKNFFNSDLSNTTARNHTMNAGVTINTLGNPYTISGLPNKNADIANFRKVRVQNTSGLDSVVDSKNLLTDGVTSMSDVEKNSFATAVNGGYSTSTMSIATIIPLMIEIIDSVQYVTVLGNNLNVNPLNFSVLILDENNNTVANVSANSNVSSATQLIFWYNFKNFTAGKYKIKINNGVSSITSTTTFDVVTSLTKTEINTSALIWKSNEYTGAIANGSGGNAAMTINHGGSITILKSNPIVNTSIGNFVLSMIGTCNFTSSWNNAFNVLSSLGVIFNGGTTIPTIETASKGILINSKFYGNITYTSIGLQSTANTSPNYTLSFEFIIQKINNTVIYLLIVNNTIVYSSYTLISTDFDISAIISGYPMSVTGGNTSYSISGISGYTY